MTDCIFCKIVKGEIPSFKIWEDKDHIAILDIFPNTEGMTLIIPKKHFDSYAFDMPDEDYSKIMNVSKTVAKILDKKLLVSRTAMVMEGMGVNHVHIKLYPMHGVEKEFREILAKEKKYYDEYPGFVDTRMGPEADKKKLEELAKKLRE